MTRWTLVRCALHARYCTLKLVCLEACVAACVCPQSTYKVQGRKERVIIALAKFPPPGYGDDSYVNFKPWYKLHHGTTDNIDVVQQFEDARLQRGVRMNEASTPKIPTMPTTNRR